MLNALLISSIYVLDQEQGTRFLRRQARSRGQYRPRPGFMRWLTVNVPGDSRQILLEKPGAPALDAKTAEQVRELVSKGATGGHLFFTTADCRKTYQEFQAKGVEFTRAHGATLRDRLRVARSIRQPHTILAADAGAHAGRKCQEGNR